jgi:hypothetical protein
LNSLLSRFEQSEERDLLQAHYTDIHQEIYAKNELLKKQKQKLRSLEREIVDIQSEFQLDRADYLDSIRRLEKRNKFYEQFFEKISPILKRDGRVCNIDKIKSESTWNDDLKKWKIPDSIIMHVKLPPATFDTSKHHTTKSIESLKVRENNSSLTAPARLECLNDSFESESESNISIDDIDKQKDIDLALTYFKPKRIEKLIKQTKGWEKLSQQNLSSSRNCINNNNPYDDPLAKTWYGGGTNNNFFQKASNPWNLNFSCNYLNRIIYACFYSLSL